MILKRRLLRLYLWHLRHSAPNWYTARYLARGMIAWIRIRMRTEEGWFVRTGRIKLTADEARAIGEEMSRAFPDDGSEIKY